MEAEFIVWAHETVKTADGVFQEDVPSVGVANIGSHGAVRFGKVGKTLTVFPRLFSLVGTDNNPTPPVPIAAELRNPPGRPESDLGLFTAGKALSNYPPPALK